jgi:tetratricopeptide (TPR) repeat protein
MTWDRRAMWTIDAAQVAQAAGDDDQAHSLLVQARALARRAADTFRDLAVADPASADLPRDLYIALHQVGLTHAIAANIIRDRARRDDPEPAPPAEGQPTPPDTPEAIEARRVAAEAEAAERARALAAYEEALALVESIARADESNLEALRDVYVCLNKVGNELRDTARLAEATPVYQRSLDLRRQVFRTDPSQRHRADLAVGLFRIVEVEQRLAQAAAPGEQLAHYQTAERFAVETLGAYQALAREGVMAEDSPQITLVQETLSAIRVKLGELRS